MSRLNDLLQAHASSGSRFSMDIFVPDRRETADEELIEDVYTRITGSPESLRFLGELLIEFASSDNGCSFDLHPNGAGMAHFNEAATLGIFVVKEPCSESGNTETNN